MYRRARLDLLLLTAAVSPGFLFSVTLLWAWVVLIYSSAIPHRYGARRVSSLVLRHQSWKAA